jgi:3-hydroxybutyryl-CoA dehydrogenase
MHDGRIGMRTGAGFLDYSGLDVDAYREQRLAAMVDLLRHFGLARPPVLDPEQPAPSSPLKTLI